MGKSFRVIDLFSGAGGMSAGFSNLSKVTSNRYGQTIITPMQ